MLQGPRGQGLGGVGSRKDGERGGKGKEPHCAQSGPCLLPRDQGRILPEHQMQIHQAQGSQTGSDFPRSSSTLRCVGAAVPAWREEEAGPGLGGRRGPSSAFSPCSAWQEGDVTPACVPLSEFSQTQQGNSTQLHLRATSHSTPPPSSPVTRRPVWPRPSLHGHVLMTAAPDGNAAEGS